MAIGTKIEIRADRRRATIDDDYIGGEIAWLPATLDSMGMDFAIATIEDGSTWLVEHNDWRHRPDA